MAREHGQGRGGAERGRARQHLVQHAAETVDVAAAVHGIANDLLGTHVQGRPDSDSRPRQLGATGGADCPRNAEVGHEGVAVLEQDVLGLDVSMDDIMCVGVGERAGYLPC